MVKKIILDNKSLFSFILFYSLVFLLTTYFYYQKLAAFGCFDDCNNFMGGYFLLKGKEIFSEFFFNHMPGVAYLSFVIQKIGNPESIYQLILYHRLFLYLFSFVMGVFLIFRFRWIALLTLVFYETTKFYIFGDRFLAESFIVYPLIYLFGLVLLKLTNVKLKTYDYIVSAIFVWFVVFTREPYIPLALLLFILVLWSRNFKRVKTWAGTLFGILTIITTLNINIHELYLNAFSYNQGITAYEFSKRGGILASLLKDFFYPLYVFLEGQINLLRIIFITISSVFIFLFYQLVKKKKLKLAFVLFLVLGIANLRFVTPGTMYYESFHMVVWYGLVIFSITFLINLLYKSKQTKILLILPLIFVILYSFISKDSYLKNPVDKTTEFNNGYAKYYAYGTAVKLISNPNDTLFLEEWDDLIYWVANLNSSYKYSWYTSLMPFVAKYKQERMNMFESNPPNFYYDACRFLNDKNFQTNNQSLESEYTRLFLNNKKSCLLVKNSKLRDITPDQWKATKPLGFSLDQALDSGL